MNAKWEGKKLMMATRTNFAHIVMMCFFSFEFSYSSCANADILPEIRARYTYIIPCAPTFIFNHLDNEYIFFSTLQVTVKNNTGRDVGGVFMDVLNPSSVVIGSVQGPPLLKDDSVAMTVSLDDIRVPKTEDNQNFDIYASTKKEEQNKYEGPLLCGVNFKK